MTNTQVWPNSANVNKAFYTTASANATFTSASFHQ